MELVLNQPAPLLKRLSWFDWLFAVIVVGGGVGVFVQYGEYLDVYERSILLGTIPSVVALGWFWKSFRPMFLLVGALSLFAVNIYDGDLSRMEENFFLEYLISSQSAIMWMCVLFALATLAYWVGTAARSDFMLQTGSVLTWIASAFGWTGLMVRWYESYQIGPNMGHFPVSNLYEVFVLYSFMTAMMYLYYEGRSKAKQMGAFVLPIVMAGVGFLIWYTFDRQGHEIPALVPALQSWWMKLHVPTNFVGYGGFAIAAMLGIAYLLVSRGIMTRYLPKLEVIDDVMYKSIAIGFVFFTIATILGAMWAAEAWGGYWSWDPKETWSLILWLTYAAWLHVRLVKGLRGPILAWWAIIGLFVTTFTFIGVNMFLSGLHSYGTL